MAEPFSNAASAVAVLGTAARIGHEVHTFFNYFRYVQADMRVVYDDFDKIIDFKTIK